MPNELTPRQLPGPLSPVSQGTTSRGISMPVPSSWIRGLRVRRCTTGGSRRRLTESTPRMSPAMPEAASRWPRPVLTEPMRSGAPPADRSRAATIASTSIGSPSAVPVPCASMAPIASGPSPASSRAARIRAICARTLGAVKPEERPSWLTALPRTTAWTRSPSRRASASRLRTTTPQPSPRVKPLARASKVLHRPSGASELVCWISRVERGERIRLTPPASATSHSPRRSAWPARWTAVREDEQAVSTATAGPISPRV
ncbi:hypothetical protein RKD37_003628 [Streptomyces ambofaciens]